MDFEAIRLAVQNAVPFNQHLHLELKEVADGKGVVTLPDRAELKNHIGSQHAAALFAAAEAASGLAVTGAFAELLAKVTPLVKVVRIEFTKVARGVITATATLSSAKREILTSVERDGKCSFDVAVELANAEGAVVGTATVQWNLRLNAPKAS
jgi:acyl-coenzyme A thioesterase PaaI-like protein